MDNWIRHTNLSRGVVDNWIMHTNFHWTLSSQWVGVSAHLVHLSSLPFDNQEDRHKDENHQIKDSGVQR